MPGVQYQESGDPVYSTHASVRGPAGAAPAARRRPPRGGRR
jgi:hypothetical protein